MTQWLKEPFFADKTFKKELHMTFLQLIFLVYSNKDAIERSLNQLMDFIQIEIQNVLNLETSETLGIGLVFSIILQLISLNPNALDFVFVSLDKLLAIAND